MKNRLWYFCCTVCCLPKAAAYLILRLYGEDVEYLKTEIHHLREQMDLRPRVPSLLRSSRRVVFKEEVEATGR